MSPFDTQFFQATILIAGPLIIVALGELMSELAGVINVGLEGMMLVGAFAGFWAGREVGNVWVAVAAGMLAGLLLSVVMAWATIEARANQIVVGVALNILGTGLSVFAFQKYSSGLPDLFIDRMRRWTIPGLSDLPLIGPALFDQIPLVYVALVCIPVAWIVYRKTTWGLRMRAAGELPESAETAGASVRALRWQGVLIAGASAGAAGAFLSVGMVGTFLGGMTAGRGYLALAAVIVGGWRPVGVAGAAVFFGAAEALQLRLQAETSVPGSVWLVLGALLLVFAAARTLGARRNAVRRGLAPPPPVSLESGVLGGLAIAAFALASARPDVSLPSMLWLALPYALTIAALAGVIVRVRQPAALGIPFVRGGGA